MPDPVIAPGRHRTPRDRPYRQGDRGGRCPVAPEGDQSLTYPGAPPRLGADQSGEVAPRNPSTSHRRALLPLQQGAARGTVALLEEIVRAGEIEGGDPVEVRAHVDQ